MSVNLLAITVNQAPNALFWGIAALDTRVWGACLVASVLVALVGHWFSRTRKAFADVL